ncbi:transcription termination factor NusA [Myxococcus stipitatus DSM 14675]|uniref:Transcription termination factor NusA n=1 Tax=Myxococcus stipitatus (strain DSM 14675 / JCM 12634 / Mx s8) TaxID=1278073 RepID=L7UG11_MYXSD|nr:hypothetical protein [Myxococcus stipitatus]AGC46933.1 transcription termination factor NusA [Myxococcus stipitatus DSM 14675]
MNQEMPESLRQWVEVEVQGGCRSEGEVLGRLRARFAAHPDVGDALESWMEQARRWLDEQDAREHGWGGEATRNDALDLAFGALQREGIVALQDVEDGWGEVAAGAVRHPEVVRGAVFYSREALTRTLVNGEALRLSFTSTALVPKCKVKPELEKALAGKVRDTLASHGLETRWDGDLDSPIEIPAFPWRKRRRNELIPDWTVGGVCRGLQLLDNVEEGAAIEGAKQFVVECAKRHYGDAFTFEASHVPETGAFDLFAVIAVVESLAEPPDSSARLLSEIEPLFPGAGFVDGDEMLMQIFYRQEDRAKARVHDVQYAGVLRMTTVDHLMPAVSASALREGILRHLPAAPRE